MPVQLILVAALGTNCTCAASSFVGSLLLFFTANRSSFVIDILSLLHIFYLMLTQHFERRINKNLFVVFGLRPI
jgi:hypothetical protein